ncbi:hypothetical protein [Streptomyces sp. NPDC001530]|uniref:hypothetical protein n=1 Tax=Streptomyces sp. NPDC001530 TaxID=3364582 RepID=UPI0036D18CD4
MHDLGFWEEIRAGDSGELILAIDTPVTMESGEGFRELVSHLETRHAVWCARERPVKKAAVTDAITFAEPWISEIRDSGRRIRAVLGYGVGGIFAGVMAEAVARWQHTAPHVLLVDPELVDTETVCRQFCDMLSALSEVLTAEEFEELRRAGAAVSDAYDDDPRTLAGELSRLVCRVRDGARTRDVPARGTARTVLGTAGARLFSLAIAESANITASWAQGTALCSSSPDSGLNRARAALLLPEAAFVRTEITFEDEHADVLKSPAVARAASEIIAG